MAGPWEQYQQPTKGPWSQYQQTDVQPPASYADRVASIPGGAEGTTPTKKTRVQSVADFYGGLAETPLALLSGAVGGVVEPLATMYGELTNPAKQGSPEANAAGQRAAQAVRRGLYQPQTETGQAIMGGIGQVTNALLPAVPVMNTIPRAIPNVRDAVNYNTPAPIRAAAENRQAAKVAQSYANAPMLDATQTAVKRGLSVNPAVTNPTAANRITGAVVGEDFNSKAAPQNAARVTDLVREDLGVAPTEKLTQASIEKALDNASQPYEVVKNLPDMVLNDTIRDRLNGLRKSDVIGSKGGSAAANGVVDHALALLEPKTKGTSLLTTTARGRSSAQLLKDIRDLRRDAQDTYKARDAGNKIDQAGIDAADTRYAVAKILEDLIDQNVKDPTVIENLKAARTRMAQIYEHDRAINYANHTVDPQAYAKMLNEGKGAMTGLGAEIGQVAAQFPDVMQTVAPKAKLPPRLTRGGIGATVGAGLGYLTGVPGAALAGTAAGAVAGEIGGRLAARRIASPEYQARNALAKDYRSAPEPQLTPAEINYGPNQLVPFDPRNAVTGAAPQGPNFSFGRSDPNIMPDRPTGPPQLGLSSAEEVLNGLAQERARAADMSRTLGRQEEARLAAAEAAAPRAPTGAGQLFDLDPITGRLVSASAGIKGATPATFSDFGMALKTAAEKVTANRNFDLTAAEKVAWSKTKIDFATAAPELKGMSDAQIAGKIMDREWAAEAVQKAREKAQAFDDIAKRAQTAQQKFNAEKSRDELLDALTSLEENIRGPRPTRSGAQGPKTRAAISNQIAPARTNRLILD